MSPLASLFSEPLFPSSLFIIIRMTNPLYPLCPSHVLFQFSLSSTHSPLLLPPISKSTTCPLCYAVSLNRTNDHSDICRCRPHYSRYLDQVTLVHVSSGIDLVRRSEPGLSGYIWPCLTKLLSIQKSRGQEKTPKLHDAGLFERNLHWCGTDQKPCLV